MLNLHASTLQLPFRASFTHSSATRARGASIWVTASDGPHVGLGEGCPRDYVTGETLDSALAFFDRHRAEWEAELTDLASLQRWQSAHASVNDQHPAAWCAVELAVLDCLARRAGQPVERLLGFDPLRNPVRYTAVIGIQSVAGFQKLASRYLALKMIDFKIKLSRDTDSDRDKLAWLAKQLPPEGRIRADANNLWSHADAAINALRRLRPYLWAVEEPVCVKDWNALRRIQRELELPLILDESLLDASTIAAMGEQPNAWIANLRISKLGGIQRTLSLLDRLKQKRIPVIVGAHVGETSILTRAALLIAAVAGDSLVASEGGFGEYLLERDAVAPSLRFGVGGALRLLEPEAPGWGLSLATG